jgi:hypothetical protein
MSFILNNHKNLDDIESEIFNAMKSVTEDFEKLPMNERNNYWITDNIKRKIGEVGEKKGYSICSSIHDSEWLYDLIWYQNKEGGGLSKLNLALESELSNRKPAGLKYDFEKILVANSDYRVFICFNEGNFEHPNNVNRLINLFDESVSTYCNLPNNSRVLVLIWDDYNTGEVYPHLIIKKNSSI